MQIADKALLKTQAFINGEWVDADDGETLAVTNPANGEVIAEVAKCGAAETRRAIEAAEAAMVDWRQRPAIGAARSERLFCANLRKMVPEEGFEPPSEHYKCPAKPTQLFRHYLS